MARGRAVVASGGKAVVVDIIMATATTTGARVEVAGPPILPGGGLRWLVLSRRRRARGHMVDLNKIPRPRAVPCSPLP